MVPKGFRKSLCMTAGVVTFLEALLWGAVSIYFISVYNCWWDIKDDDNQGSWWVWRMLYNTYLRGKCSESEGLSRAASSLQVWLWANAVLSVIWIQTCIILLVAVKEEIKGKKGAMMYYPWEALTFIIIVFDLAGTIYHSLHIFKTTTRNDYAKFSFNSTWDNLMNQMNMDQISKDNAIPWLPSLFVTLFFCRLIVIWILNVLYFVEVYKASRIVASYKTKKLQKSEDDDIGFDNLNFAIDEDQYINMQHSNSNLYNQPTRLHSSQDNNYTVEELNRDVRISDVGRLPQSPFHQRRHVGYIIRPLTPDSFNEQYLDAPPPMASDIKVAPELSRIRPFSYTAGDQPQLIRSAGVSRSNSRVEYPPIPHPDYSGADRRAASLEYIPNRFRVPSPKRPTQTPITLDHQSSPNQLKKGLTPHRNDHQRPPHTVIGEGGFIHKSKYITSQNQQIHSRQSSQNGYNINRFY